MAGDEHSYHQYFGSGELTGPLADRLCVYRTFLEDNGDAILRQDIAVGTLVVIVTLDHSQLCALPGFQEDLSSSPSVTLSVLSTAMAQVLQTDTRLTVRLSVPTGSPARFSSLKASLIGRWAVFSGTVVRSSAPRPRPEQAVWECGKCGRVQTARLREGLCRQPAKCGSSGCTGRSFCVRRDHADTIYRNWQRIRIQEVVPCSGSAIEYEADDIDLDFHDGEDDVGGHDSDVENTGSNNHALAIDHNGGNNDGAGVPKYLDVDLFDDLVEKAAPGERVVVCGVVKVDEGEGRERAGRSALSYSLYLECNNIFTSCNQIDDGGTIMCNPSKATFSHLVASLCPSIYGHTLVKAGLLLALLGGSRKGNGGGGSGSSNGNNGSGNNSSSRKDSHVLLLGDPGLGKSGLLNAVCKAAPRSVFVSATTATAAGLTATISMDPTSGEWGLEAGALVLADDGICCIDELDKSAGDCRCLLEAMEQQQVNIAKAGVVCSLPARCSVIAAANPVGGHYNPKRSILENVKLDAALLSRFDLLFVLLDKADAQLDRYLSDRIVQRNSARPFSDSQLLYSDDDEVSVLASKLSDFDPNGLLSQEALRLYIQSARQAVHPRLSEEAKAVIKRYYLELRRSRSRSALPVTVRQLEALVRLSEARARSELRSLVTAEDARDVVGLMRFATSELVALAPLPPHQKKTAMGRGNQMKRFVSELQVIADNTRESCYSELQLRQLHTSLQLTLPFAEMIDTLNQSGILLKKDTFFKLLS